MPDQEQPSRDVKALEAEIARLNKVVDALMDRSEASMNVQGSDFGLFQTTIMLQDQVRLHTEALETALLDRAADPGESQPLSPGDMQTLRRTAALQIQLLELVVRQKDVGELIEQGGDDPRHAHRALRHARPRRLVLAERGRCSRPRAAPLGGAPGGARCARPRLDRHRRRRAGPLPRRARHGPRRAGAGRREHPLPADGVRRRLSAVPAAARDARPPARQGRAQDAASAAARPPPRRPRRRRGAGPAPDPAAGAGVRRRERAPHRHRRTGRQRTTRRRRRARRSRRGRRCWPPSTRCSATAAFPT